MELEFDSTNVKSDSFDALPDGEYPVIVTESKMKETKAGDGAYLQLNLSVLEGPYKGKTLFDRLNLKNPNPLVMDIANRQLAGLCKAVNKEKIRDSGELHNIPVTVKVKFRRGENGYDDSNDVKRYKPYQTSGAGTGGGPTAGTPFVATKGDDIPY